MKIILVVLAIAFLFEVVIELFGGTSWMDAFDETHGKPRDE